MSEVNELDESLERENYEHSNAIHRCQIHGIEMDLTGECPQCVYELELYREGC